jgi:hypothetical protein
MGKTQLIMSVTYYLRFHWTKFCVLSFPAIWWLSVKLQCGSVTETDVATVYIDGITACRRQNVEEFEEKSTS